MTSHTHSFAPEIIGQQSPSAPAGCRLPPALPRLGTSWLCGTQLFQPFLPAWCLPQLLLSLGKALEHLPEGHYHCSAGAQKHVPEWKWTQAITMHSHGEG